MACQVTRWKCRKENYKMTIIVLLPILVAIIGALVYALASGKASELGRIAFFCGLLAFLMTSSQQVVTLLGK
jgi:energy-converting hydrogenase Eha subunit A